MNRSASTIRYTRLQKSSVSISGLVKTGVYAVQVSVAMAEADKRIGALTFTLKLRRSDLR